MHVAPLREVKIVPHGKGTQVVLIYEDNYSYVGCGLGFLNQFEAMLCDPIAVELWRKTRQEYEAKQNPHNNP